LATSPSCQPTQVANLPELPTPSQPHQPKWKEQVHEYRNTKHYSFAFQKTSKIHFVSLLVQAMDLTTSFNEHIAREQLFHPADKLFLAVSGGLDSVVLCELCKRAGFEFGILHCNFNLRGDESKRDEVFVKGLSDTYKVPVWIKSFDTEKYAVENKLSIQESARELRYGWFFEFIQGVDKNVSGSAWVLTAHHADDNIETVLMNFFRGTGLHGLAGIAAKSSPADQAGKPFICRPLLKFTRVQLAEFAKANNLEHVEDSSNQSSKYTRNFFRHDIIPAIEIAYPAVRENLRENILRFGEIEKLYQFSVGEIKKKICRQKGEDIHIPVRQLMGYQNRALIYEIIREAGFHEKQVDELIKLAESETGKFISSATHRIIKHRHWFIITPVGTDLADNIIIEEGTDRLLVNGREYRLEIMNKPPAPIPDVTDTVYFDLKQVRYPLLLRKWKPGDYFYPLGMKKKKKLARFFIDQKLSMAEKEKIWVLESNYRVMWIVGYRIDERFRISEKTGKVLKITIE
jgi:tRNA(Ile)-lysidine synthase